LESAGAGQYQELFTQLRAAGIVEQPDIMARAAKTTITAMGEAETGTFRDLVSKAFGASKFSPALAEQLLEAASKSSVSAKGIGLSDEEILAATAVVSSAKGRAETGGTYFA
jgi:hypothetical protein